MAALEGNELVNVESVTALMALFGAKYRASSFEGTSVASYYISSSEQDHPSNTVLVSRDGSTASLKKTGGPNSYKTTTLTFVSGEDALFYVFFGLGFDDTSGVGSSGNVTISISQNTTVVSPSSIRYSNILRGDKTFLDGYVRLKEGEQLKIVSKQQSGAIDQIITTTAKVIRIC